MIIYKRSHDLWLVTMLVLVALMTGCHGSGGDGNGTGWIPIDTTAPMVTLTDPAPGDADVGTNRRISVTFSEAMNPATVTAAGTFALAGAGTPVAGTVTYVGLTAVFAPDVAMGPTKVYTATITTAAQDLAGDALAANYTWTFTTGAGPDIISPTVTVTAPSSGETGVAINRKVAATFSKTMDPATITMTTFTVTSSVTADSGTVAYAGQTATFTPAADLAIDTVYTATITPGAADLAGNALPADYVWTFRTGAAPDKTAPTVTLTNPAHEATAVPLNQKIAATFSEAMDPATITNLTFALASGTTAVSGTVIYVGLIATFRPAAALEASSLYTATITPGAKDLAGDTLVGYYTWTFTTDTIPDLVKPTVLSVNPLDAAANVPINKKINATFSKAIDPATITNLTFRVAAVGPPVANVAGTVIYDAATMTATFMPTVDLLVDTYNATITVGPGGAKDLAGNELDYLADYVWTFTTVNTRIPDPVALGAAAPFGSFGGGAGMTNQGLFTVINGDIGTTGASTLITGFRDKTGRVYTVTPLNNGYVNGTIYTATAPPSITPGVVAAQGALDARAAYNNLTPASLPGGIDLGNDQLGGRTLAPGIYQAAGGSYQITGTDLTLDGQGDAGAIWVFQMASSLTVGGPGAAFPQSVLLVNSAQAKNVFWQVGSAATINAGAGGTMVGTIIAEAGVTFSTAGNTTLTVLNGRALGLNASVTLVNTVITIPTP